MNQPNDDILFDRLVDGELSSGERERLLTSLDQTEDGWRRCALAFLENQAWRRQMKAIAAPPGEDAAHTRAVSAQHNDPRRLYHLTLAAGLLLAFLVGWMSRPDSPAVSTADQLAESKKPPAVEPQAIDPLPSLDDHDVVTLLVRDEFGDAKRVRVPLVELGGTDDESKHLVDALPSTFRKRLQRQGMDLRGRRRYAPFYIEQNQEVVPMAVPVDDAYVVPVSRPVF